MRPLSLAVTGSGTISGTLAPGGIAFSGTGPTITVSVNPSATTTYTIATLADGTCTAQAVDMKRERSRDGEPEAYRGVERDDDDLRRAKCDLEFGGDRERNDQRDAGPGRCAFSGTGPTITVWSTRVRTRPIRLRPWSTGAAPRRPVT